MTPPDFTDPSLWATDADVPLLGEGRLAVGGRVVPIDRPFLEKVARRMNRKFARTGDAAVVVVGSPGGGERPVVGYCTRFRVAYRPDAGVSVLSADQHTRRDRVHVRRDFPRRSVELWPDRHEIDPVVLLPPAGAVRYSRQPDPGPDPAAVVEYARRTGFRVSYDDAVAALRGQAV